MIALRVRSASSMSLPGAPSASMYRIRGSTLPRASATRHSTEERWLWFFPAMVVFLPSWHKRGLIWIKAIPEEWSDDGCRSHGLSRVPRGCTKMGLPNAAVCKPKYKFISFLRFEKEPRTVERLGGIALAFLSMNRRGGGMRAWIAHGVGALATAIVNGGVATTARGGSGE
jgi:hypothetical protein